MDGIPSTAARETSPALMETTQDTGKYENRTIRNEPFRAENAEVLEDPKNCRYTSEGHGLWNTVFFGHLTKVILRGIRTKLEAKDLQPLHTSFSTRQTSEDILRLWRKEDTKRKARSQNEEPPPESDDQTTLTNSDGTRQPVNMISLICRAFRSQLIFAHLFYLGTIFTAAVPPFLIGELAVFLKDEHKELRSGLYIAGILFISQQLNSLLLAHTQGLLYNVSFKVQSGFSSAIYQKCLRLSSRATKEYPTGDIVNLISVDLENVKQSVASSYALWGAPFTLVFVHVLIYQYLGIYSLAGALAIVLFAPFVVLMTKLEGYLQVKQMERKDARVDLITEVFNNIRVVKLYAWESSFAKRIRSIRTQECRIMYAYLGAWNIMGFTWNCYPFFVSAAAIAAYMFLNSDGVINPKIVLVTIAYFSSLRNDFIMFPVSVSEFVRARVSLGRIRAFLEAEEVNPEAIKEDLGTDEEISFKNATFTWDEDEGPVLRNINLSIKKGELVAIVGSVAAGKSSLVQAIAGELSPTSGSMSRQRTSRVAYVPQQAWILNDTIRNNILFGSPIEPETYRDVVKKCCLLPDLRILPAGDATEIGEKGVNLSGGQKQRVSLARAAYQNANIYLLDDPLSAVDAHVALDLFNEIVGPTSILKSTTRVLVTHSVSVLPHVDRIVVLEDGEVTHQGTYEEIMRDNVRLKELVETHAKTDESAATAVESPEGCQKFSKSLKRTTSISSTSSNIAGNIQRQMSEIPSGRLIDEEEMEEGKVRYKVYIEFIWRFGVVAILLFTGGYSLARVADLKSLFYMTNFSKEIDENNGTTKEVMWQHMQVYLAYGGVNSFGMVLGLFSLTFGCIWTSTNLHNKMLDAVLKAPMSFFDSTPTGRILNRFSRDVDELDIGLYGGADGYTETWIMLIVSVTWVCIELPVFISVVVPLLLIFVGIQKLYMASSRQFKRLDAVTRSPVLNCFNESLAGTASIRTYGVQNNFISKHMRLLDNNQNCIFHELIGYRWLAVRLDFLGSMIDFGVCCMLLYFRHRIESEIAALIFSISLRASSAFCWIVTFGAQLENSFVSAERVLDYMKTKSEAPWFVEGDVDASWPQSGEVCFEDYSTRYKVDLDLVLKKVNLRLKAGEKTGIVGRTGAGKSSLTLALLRIIEATEGRILIDGIDISKLGLTTLRSRLAIIPQDPVLFRGSLRDNVDPEGKFSDEEVWAALERAHLKSDDKPITYKVDEGGSNLSVGERQLVCLARALLRNSKILILDEATAAVDLQTDALIQETIRQDFDGSTVITIAHRLHTIMDYDNIVVLDHGEVREVGSPRSLLEDTDGIFSNMARDANIRCDT